jgi:VanZ family protein
MIEQSIGDLVVRGNFQYEHHPPAFRSLWLDRALQENQTRFVTITSGPQGTVLYLEGVRARAYAYTPAGSNLAGRLVLGHSTEGRNTWAGNLLGLAVYDHMLSSEEVFRNYQAWTGGRSEELKAEKGVVGLYLFGEHSGDAVRNHAGSMPELIIPARFSVLRKVPLIRSFKLHRSDLKDAVINILGFVPFGLLVSAYLRWNQLSGRKAAIFAVIVGGVTSLLIEWLQVYLPSRDSSLLDLINNMIGSGLGAVLLSWLVRRRLAARDLSSC